MRRNRFALLLYGMLCLLFLVVGIAVGVNVSEKADYVLRNNAVIFKFLRGDTGIVAFFFLELVFAVIYILFAASVFFYRPLSFLSLAPCAYRSYVLGMNVSIIISVYSVSALPMLLVVYIPACIVEVVVLCMVSYKCFVFVSLNRCGMPSRPDIREYYKQLLSCMFVTAVALLLKAVTLALFGSALIGIV